MKKINRLGRGIDMTALMRYGRRVSSPLFQLAVQSTPLPHPRFVFVVGRAVDKRAVIRNRLRRRGCRAEHGEEAAEGGGGAFYLC